MSLLSTIKQVRASTVAVLRFRAVVPPRDKKKNRSVGTQYEFSWGSGVCVVGDRYVLTAHHNLNGGKELDPQDSFVIFTVPDNGDRAFHFPVTAVPLQRSDCDLAILELGKGATPGVSIPALPIKLTVPTDGSRVVTVGFPSPEVASLSIDPQGQYRGGSFFLKSHANEGILAAQYPATPFHLCEYNVEWHHGESGGPVVHLEEPLGVVSLMQHYRNIQGPHGILPGPRRGFALSAIEVELRNLGASIAAPRAG